MSPFFGIKVLMAVVVCIPIISLIIYFLIRPLPTEIPADAAHFNAGLQFHQEGRFYLSRAEYDLATEINSANLEAFQKRGDAYFAKGELGRAVSDYNAAISIRSLLISGLGSQKGPLSSEASRKPTWGRPWSMLGKAGT